MEVFDLFEYPNSWLIKAHKGAEVQFCSGYLDISYKKQNNQTSAGFYIEYKTNPDTKYNLKIRAQLFSPDIDDNLCAFVYCEARSDIVDSQSTKHIYTRLVPRTFFFYPEDKHPTSYNISFIAKTDCTYIGILFFTKEHDYQLHVTDFIMVPEK